HFNRTRRLPLLFIELTQRIQGRNIRSIRVNNLLIRVDGLVKITDFVPENGANVRVELKLRLSIRGFFDVTPIGAYQVKPSLESTIASGQRNIRLPLASINFKGLFEVLCGNIRLEKLPFLHFRDGHE